MAVRSCFTCRKGNIKNKITDVDLKAGHLLLTHHDCFFVFLFLMTQYFLRFVLFFYTTVASFLQLSPAYKNVLLPTDERVNN